MIGERLGEHTVLAKIGKGGMGTVYLASDRRGARVALKVLDPAGDGDPTLRRFAQELELLRKVAHPRIVRALGPIERAGERTFFAMEYVRGRNLAQVLAEVGRLEPVDALTVAAEALEGLGAAHALGVLHRDVKSANLLLGEDGGVKVCDFGLARAVDQTRVTLSGQLLGTPAYASPEQARGHESRVESDLYSLGVVLYEALTGTLPFRAETPLALLRLHLDEAPDPPSARRPGLPASVDALLLKALAKRPQDRFASADAMRAAVLEARAALVSATDGAPTTTLDVVRRQVSTESAALERSAVEVERAAPRRRAALAMVCLAVAAAGLAWTAWRRGEPTPPLGVAAVPSSSSPAAAPEVASAGSSTEVVMAPRARATVTGRDGAVQAGALVSIARGEVRLRRDDGREVVVPLAEVASIRYDPGPDR